MSRAVTLPKRKKGLLCVGICLSSFNVFFSINEAKLNSHPYKKITYVTQTCLATLKYVNYEQGYIHGGGLSKVSCNKSLRKNITYYPHLRFDYAPQSEISKS